MPSRSPSRREFLASASLLAVATACRGGGSRPAAAAPTAAIALPLRALGRTRRAVPALGLGCYPLGNLAEDAALAILGRALESGARYLDTAPSYNSGTSERYVGKAIRAWKREELHIATKTLARDGDAALKELEESLERLGTDYVDTLQVHAVHEDWESLFGSGKLLPALEAARERKQLRHIGITGHEDPQYLLAAMERYDFASALVPVNPIDCHHRSFVRELLPLAKAKGTAVIAMKVYAGGKLPQQRKLSPTDLVRFALAQAGVCVAVPGADSIERWNEAHAAALLPAPDAAEQRRMIEAALPYEGKDSEWYKDA
jgi:aryl-alcohol dehydrogenase-like predicted oxidoreductase